MVNPSPSRYANKEYAVEPLPEAKETVNHPPHYGGDTTYEVIKVIEAWGLNASFCLGNVIKYVARAPFKGNALEDLKKARWYLDHEIQRMEKKP
jgi:hypothetical protein